MRQRIEAELEDGGPRRRRAEADPVDPEATLAEVRRFVGLARSGAYLAGDRRVSPRERSRWRLTFRALVRDVEAALRQEDLDPGAGAMALLVDLAREVRDDDDFRSEDPIEAARVVVSDEVGLLWSEVLARRGFAAFSRSAPGQLLRWESELGWTRTGVGRVREREASLASVLAGLLGAPDHWVAVADGYLEALDALAARSAEGSARRRRPPTRDRDRRTGDLREWHLPLLDRLVGGEDRLAAHPGLGGPELSYVRVRLATPGARRRRPAAWWQRRWRAFPGTRASPPRPGARRPAPTPGRGDRPLPRAQGDPGSPEADAQPARGCPDGGQGTGLTGRRRGARSAAAAGQSSPAAWP